MNDDAFTLHRGSTPLLVSVPHAGTLIPAELRPALVDRALLVEDTDWFLDHIYAFVRDLGAGLIVPRFSRYVVDLNRPPQNTPMYPGVNNTELCPTRFFTGGRLYREGHEPDENEVRRRVDAYWRPYHEAISGELERLKSAAGHAVLFDAHSIKSELPWLFEGRLHDLNLGSAGGASCAASLRARLAEVLERQASFSQVIDGRFKGGHITRHYGRPGDSIHAVQLEMCWSCYMDEHPPWQVEPQRLARLEPVLRALVSALLEWKPERA